MEENTSLKIENKIETDVNNLDIEIPKLVEETPRSIENLVLSGGGVKAISQIGSIKKLIELNYLDLSKIKKIAGVSAGALLGLLLVLKFDIDTIWDFMYNIDLKKMINPNYSLILQKCGVDTGKTIYDLIEEIITKKTGIKHITFIQLYELMNIEFTVVGSCLTTKQAVYYNHTNTPNFKVSMAIRISIGLPGILTPIEIGNKKYIDGGAINNYPINLFEKELDKTIGIFICNEYNTDYKYPEEYFMAIFNLFMYMYYNKTTEKYDDYTIYIKEIPKSISIFNFDVDNQSKQELFQLGIKSAMEFYEKKINK